MSASGRATEAEKPTEQGARIDGLAELVPRVDSLRELSAGENRHDLAAISDKAAGRQVRDGHFPPAFDLTA